MSLWGSIHQETFRNFRFFLISFLYNNLENYYKLMFSMMHDHNFNIMSLEEMIPWERDVYVILLQQWIEEENKRMEEYKNK